MCPRVGSGAVKHKSLKKSALKIFSNKNFKMLPKTWSCVCLLKISKIISIFSFRTHVRTSLCILCSGYKHGASFEYFCDVHCETGGENFFSYFKIITQKIPCASNSLIYCSIEIEFPVKIFLTHTLNDFQVSEWEKRQSIPYQVMQSLHSPTTAWWMSKEQAKRGNF